MNNQVSSREKIAEIILCVSRIAALIGVVLMFFPAFNPAKVCALVNKNLSVFTSAISWSGLTQDVGVNLRFGIVTYESFHALQYGCLAAVVGVLLAGVGACMSLGNLKMKKLSTVLSLAGSAVIIAGMAIVYFLGYKGIYNSVVNTENWQNVLPSVSNGIFVFLAVGVIGVVASLISIALLPMPAKEDRFEMKTKYKLFLIMLPFLVLCFVFSYLPLFGWRYAFFRYQPGQSLTSENFVGFYWFQSLVSDPQTRKDVLFVLRNTLIMSGLGVATSWVPMVFAIFLNEIKSKWFRRVVQVFTTIPNFVSWVLVYSLALALFSSDGLLNHLMGTNILFLQDYAQYTWFQMLAWGMWKGTGWAAIIYIAGISGISQELYEAATVDGAGRFQKMWHITVPGLLPTYFVLLLMSIGNILSNGMDQYLVFFNPVNANYINVLDLYVYKLGLGGGDAIPLSTVVSMTKSLISIILLFTANGISKAIRGESIM